nr:unnamed protein product [Callosobruchus analis]
MYMSFVMNEIKNINKKYKRVINGGKGSRAVVVLVPEAYTRFNRNLPEIY